MTEHDARILRPKSKAIRDQECLREYAQSHHWCAACGAESHGTHTLTIHHIIGGRGGRSDEECNLLMLGWEPCHMLAEGLDVRGEMGYVPRHDFPGIWEPSRPLLPKITLGVALAMKVKAGELQRLISPQWDQLVLSPEWERLTVLHGRTLPDLEAIPPYFEEQWRRNRPELNGGR